MRAPYAARCAAYLHGVRRLFLRRPHHIKRRWPIVPAMLRASGTGDRREDQTGTSRMNVTVTRSDGSSYLIHDPSIRRGACIETILDGQTPIVIKRGEGAHWIEAEVKPLRATCKRGHIRNERNSRIDKRGYYRCIICSRNLQRINRLRKLHLDFCV